MTLQLATQPGELPTPGEATGTAAPLAVTMGVGKRRDIWPRTYGAQNGADGTSTIRKYQNIGQRRVVRYRAYSWM